MNEDKILAAIAELNESVKGRLDGIEDRLAKVEEAVDVNARFAKDLYKHQRKHSKDIDELFARVDALCDSDSVVWRGKHDRNKIGLDRQTVYDTISDCGFDRRDGLRIISDAGRLDRGEKQYTKVVREGDRVFRAIVILEKE